MSSEKLRKIVIQSPKNNTKICEIEAPQKWWADLLSSYMVWANPDIILKWAWRQAWIIASELNDIGIVNKGDILPSNFRCQCLICHQISFAPIGRHWFWSKHHKHIGFWCSNRECKMYKVLIPTILLGHIDEIPEDYLSHLALEKHLSHLRYKIRPDSEQP
jgi:hypothetical protein